MPTRRHALAAFLAAPAAAAFTLSGLPAPALAGEPETFAVGGIAIRGTDPVAYFDQGMPVVGSQDHEVMWRGATWRFASAENRARFEADPMSFAPAYGGYCAYAASLGYLAPTDPDAWTIYEGRLYLNANRRARTLWSQDIPGNIAKGDANWPAILG